MEATCTKVAQDPQDLPIVPSPRSMQRNLPYTSYGPAYRIAGMASIPSSVGIYFYELDEGARQIADTALHYGWIGTIHRALIWPIHLETLDDCFGQCVPQAVLRSVSIWTTHGVDKLSQDAVTYVSDLIAHETTLP